MTDGASRFIDGWDEARKEWDSTIKLPDSERCGLTSSPPMSGTNFSTAPRNRYRS